MITYEPFWDYLDWHEISTYTLITKHHVSSSTINRLRHNQPVSTATIDNELYEIYHDYLYIEVMPEEKKKAAFYQKCGFTLMEDGAALQICNFADKR